MRTELELISAEPWDLLQLDWTLPDCSGVEICRRLRSSLNTTPVLMLTGVDGFEDRVKALDGGANDYLLKPFSIEEPRALQTAPLQQLPIGRQQGPGLEGGPLRREDQKRWPANLQHIPADHLDRGRRSGDTA